MGLACGAAFMTHMSHQVTAPAPTGTARGSGTASTTKRPRVQRLGVWHHLTQPLVKRLRPQASFFWVVLAGCDIAKVGAVGGCGAVRCRCMCV